MSHPVDNLVIGHAVRRFREQRGMSQTRLAREMRSYGHGWHQVTINRTESGERPLRLDEALALAEVLHVAVAELYQPISRDTKREYEEALTELEQREAELRETILARDAFVRDLSVQEAAYTQALHTLEVARKALQEAQKAEVRAGKAAQAAEQQLLQARDAVDTFDAEVSRQDDQIERVRQRLARLKEEDYQQFQDKARDSWRQQILMVRALYEKSMSPDEIAEYIGETTRVVEDMIRESESLIEE